MRVDGLMPVRPSREMQQALWAYRAELLAHGETRINGTSTLRSLMNLKSGWPSQLSW